VGFIENDEIGVKMREMAAEREVLMF